MVVIVQNIIFRRTADSTPVKWTRRFSFHFPSPVLYSTTLVCGTMKNEPPGPFDWNSSWRRSEIDIFYSANHCRYGTSDRSARLDVRRVWTTCGHFLLCSHEDFCSSLFFVSTKCALNYGNNLTRITVGSTVIGSWNLSRSTRSILYTCPANWLVSS